MLSLFSLDPSPPFSLLLLFPQFRLLYTALYCMIPDPTLWKEVGLGSRNVNLATYIMLAKYFTVCPRSYVQVSYYTHYMNIKTFWSYCITLTSTFYNTYVPSVENLYFCRVVSGFVCCPRFGSGSARLTTDHVQTAQPCLGEVRVPVQHGRALQPSRNQRSFVTQRGILLFRTRGFVNLVILFSDLCC